MEFLPDDCIFTISLFLDDVDTVALSSASSILRTVLTDSLVWQPRVKKWSLLWERSGTLPALFSAFGSSYFTLHKAFRLYGSLLLGVEHRVILSNEDSPYGMVCTNSSVPSTSPPTFTLNVVSTHSGEAWTLDCVYDLATHKLTCTNTVTVWDVPEGGGEGEGGGGGGGGGGGAAAAAVTTTSYTITRVGHYYQFQETSGDGGDASLPFFSLFQWPPVVFGHFNRGDLSLAEKRRGRKGSPPGVFVLEPLPPPTIFHPPCGGLLIPSPLSRFPAPPPSRPPLPPHVLALKGLYHAHYGPHGTEVVHVFLSLCEPLPPCLSPACGGGCLPPSMHLASTPSPTRPWLPTLNPPTLSAFHGNRDISIGWLPPTSTAMLVTELAAKKGEGEGEVGSITSPLWTRPTPPLAHGCSMGATWALCGVKVCGDPNVPSGQVTFVASVDVGEDVTLEEDEEEEEAEAEAGKGKEQGQGGGGQGQGQKGRLWKYPAVSYVNANPAAWAPQKEKSSLLIREGGGNKFVIRWGEGMLVEAFWDMHFSKFG